jgi:hypothetical protein
MEGEMLQIAILLRFYVIVVSNTKRKYQAKREIALGNHNRLFVKWIITQAIK